MNLVATTFTFCVACILSLLASSLLRRAVVGSRMRALRDVPEGDGIHCAARNVTGGLAVLAAWLTTLGVAVYVFGELPASALAFLFGVTPALLLVAGLGLVDDLSARTPLQKLVVQALALSVAHVATGVLDPLFALDPWARTIASAVAVLYALGLTNATNLIDGLDGLATGVSAIAALGLTLMALMVDDAASAVLAVSIAGVSVGFLRMNVTPARSFLGDTGSLFLGMALALVSLRIFALRPEPTTALALLLLHWVASLDLVFAVWRRLAQGRSPFRGDRGHVHHRLVRAGMRPRLAVRLLWSLSLLAATAAVQSFRTESPLMWAMTVVLATLPLAWILRPSRNHGRRDAAEGPATPAPARGLFSRGRAA